MNQTIKPLLRVAVIVGALGVTSGALAAPRTATLEIKNASCATCVPIVRWTLKRIAGVSQVAVGERDGIATASVTFDDERVAADTLAQATTNAGFPSTVRDLKAIADLHCALRGLCA